MKGKEIKKIDDLNKGDTIIEKRIRYIGLEAKITNISQSGWVELVLTKEPKNNEENLSTGEYYDFSFNLVLDYFLKKIEKNSIKKL